MKNNILKISNLAFLFCALLLTTGCDFDFPLPEANSIDDLQLPVADFTESQDPVDFRTYQFQNLSSESLNYEWDFGTGETSSDENPLYRFEAGEGTYTVTLVSSDANGESDRITRDIVVIEPEAPDAIIPRIMEASFEDGQLEGGSGDGRDSWRNNSLGGVIQITSSPVFDGDQASKYPREGDRIAYQELEITPNTDYRFDFVYTLKTDAPGSITFDVLAGGGYSSVSGAEVLGSFTGTDQDDSGTYTEASVRFNTGNNNMISIYVHNEGEEARLDAITIEVEE
jgi:PKD repeat protein